MPLNPQLGLLGVGVLLLIWLVVILRSRVLARRAARAARAARPSPPDRPASPA
jgi:hypothetical protein